MKRFFVLFIFFSMFFAFSPLAQADIELGKKDLKDLESMEKRHYRNPANEFESNEYRLNRLETTFFGQTFDDMDTKERMRRLRIASQKMFMTGAALPVGMSSRKINARDDVTQIIDNDNVGIIDGLLRLYAPQLYTKIQEKNERIMRNEIQW